MMRIPEAHNTTFADKFCRDPQDNGHAVISSTRLSEQHGAGVRNDVARLRVHRPEKF
jgi:hypothetical protein